MSLTFAPADARAAYPCERCGGERRIPKTSGGDLIGMIMVPCPDCASTPPAQGAELIDRLGEHFVPEGRSSSARPDTLGAPLTPGVNLDQVDIAAGVRKLEEIGYNGDPRTCDVIIYALQRWARGEEAAAEKAAIDTSFHGISLTSWRMVLAAALAHGEAEAIR